MLKEAKAAQRKSESDFRATLLKRKMRSKHARQSSRHTHTLSDWTLGVDLDENLRRTDTHAHTATHRHANEPYRVSSTWACQHMSYSSGRRPTNAESEGERREGEEAIPGRNIGKEQNSRRSEKLRKSVHTHTATVSREREEELESQRERRTHAQVHTVQK